MHGACGKPREKPSIFGFFSRAGEIMKKFNY